MSRDAQTLTERGYTMRTVFTNRMLTHVFANQTQEHGRSNSMRFDKDTLQSYNTPVARIVDSAFGNKVLLTSSYSYSVTTAQHLGQVRGAWIGHGPSFTVPSLGVFGGRRVEAYPDGTPSHASNLAFLLGEHKKNILRGQRMMQDPWADMLDWTGGQVVDYARAFALTCPIDLAQDKADLVAFRVAREARLNTPANIAKREKARLAREKRAEAKAELERERRRIYALGLVEQFKLWRAGADIRLPYGVRGENDDSDMIRIKPNEPETVQTSQGAEVPTSHARGAYSFIRREKEQGRSYSRADDLARDPHASTMRIGHFSLDTIDTEGNVHIGCHRISWREISTFAQTQGW